MSIDPKNLYPGAVIPLTPDQIAALEAGVDAFTNPIPFPPSEDEVEIAFMSIRKSADNIRSQLRILKASGRLSAFAIAHASHLKISVDGIQAALRMEPSDAPRP